MGRGGEVSLEYLCLHSLSLSLSLSRSPLSAGMVMVSCRVGFLHLHSFSISSAFSLFIQSVRQFFFYKCKPHAVGGR